MEEKTIMEITITKCDRCSPKTKVKLGRWLDTYCHETINGVFRGGFSEARAQGWDQRDYGTICPACIIEESREESLGAAEVGLEAFEETLANSIKTR